MAGISLSNFTERRLLTVGYFSLALKITGEKAAVAARTALDWRFISCLSLYREVLGARFTHS